MPDKSNLFTTGNYSRNLYTLDCDSTSSGRHNLHFTMETSISRSLWGTWLDNLCVFFGAPAFFSVSSSISSQINSVPPNKSIYLSIPSAHPIRGESRMRCCANEEATTYRTWCLAGKDLLHYKTVEEFWIHTIGAYRNVANTPRSLLSFASTYLCKTGISTMLFIKLYIEIALNWRMTVRYVLLETSRMIKLLKNKQYQISRWIWLNDNLHEHVHSYEPDLALACSWILELCLFVVFCKLDHQCGKFGICYFAFIFVIEAS